MEDRQKLWDEYTGAKPLYLGWPWLKYNRYTKAEYILNTLKKRGEDISKLQVLDYGSGVGDYGFVFGRQGAVITFFDLKEQIDFTKYRVEKEPIKAEFYLVDLDNPITTSDPLDKFLFDIIIFGEVLEHLLSPLEVLTKAVNSQVKYIYTSSYPYRSDDPDESYWKHHGEDDQTVVIQMQQPCRELLELNYTYVKYDGQARLWIRK